jgi:hypothetical protein
MVAATTAQDKLAGQLRIIELQLRLRGLLE